MEEGSRRSTHPRAELRFRAAVSIIVVAIVAVGCDAGQDPAKAAFAGDYRQVTKDLQERTRAIQAAAGSSSSGIEGLISSYEDILQSTELATDAYSQLSPPDDFEPVFSELVESLESQEQALTRLVDAAETNDTDALSKATTDLAASMTEWQRSVTEMNELLAACEECQ